MTESILEVENIEVVYNKTVQVLRGLSLAVPARADRRAARLNGAGKCTTLKAISNLLPLQNGALTAGRIRFDGRDIAGRPPHALVREGLFHVMEGRRVFEDLTVEENLVAATYALTGRAGLAPDFDAVYGYFPRLHERRKGLAGYLSGGEQQMLAIGRALVARADADAARRAVARPVAGAGREDLRDHRPHQRRAGASRCCWSSRTRRWPWRSRTTATSWNRARWSSTTRAERLAADPDVREFYLGLGDEGGHEELPRREALQAPQALAVMSLATAACRRDLTLPQALARQATTRPDAIAIRQKEFGIWKPMTWAELHRRARRVGLGLRALGLDPGRPRRHPVREPARMGAGAARRRARRGGDGRRLSDQPGGEVAYVLGHADVEVVVCEDQEQSDKVLAALPMLPRLRRIVVHRDKGLADTRARAPALVIGFDEFEAMAEAPRREGRPTRRRRDRRRVLDAASRWTTSRSMIYTSGSTGKPKGAMISYGNIARDGRRRRRPARPRTPAPRTCRTCRSATWPSRC